METSFFQSLIARQPCEEMSYKVQRPLPTVPGAPTAGDALPSPAWWGVRRVPWFLCLGSLGPVLLCWPCARMLAGPSPHHCGAECWGSRRQPSSWCRDGGAGAPLGSRILPGFRVSLCQRSPSCCNAPASHRILVALCSGRGCRPGGTLDPPGCRATDSLAGRLPPHRASCSRQRPVGSRREGTDAAAPAAKALPSVCSGLPGWGGYRSPQPPHLSPGALQHCRAGCPPKTVSPGLCGRLGKGSGTLRGGRKQGRPGRLPAFLCGVVGPLSPPRGHRSWPVLPPP